MASSPIARRTFGCAAAIVLGGALLAGCAHVVRLDLEDFDYSRVPERTAERDSAECGLHAVDMQNRIGGSEATYIFNRAYAACMHEHGYREHPDALDLF